MKIIYYWFLYIGDTYKLHTIGTTAMNKDLIPVYWYHRGSAPITIIFTIGIAGAIVSVD